MRRAGPSAPCKKGICDAEKTHLVRNKKSNLHQWLTRFQVATERLQESVRKVQAWRSLSLPASSVAAKGLSKLLAANGDMSSKQPTVNELVGNKQI
jgi:hypothetical protein